MSDNSPANTRHLLELQVPDYLNDHLDPGERVEVENAMASDAEFKAYVEQERVLMSSLAESRAAAQIRPDFDGLAEKIERRRGWMSLSVGGSAIAACALVFLVGAGNWMNNNVALNDFETLSSAPSVAAANTVRLIGADSVTVEELESVIASYDLVVVQEIPSLKVFDVSMESTEGAQKLMKLLDGDTRFRSVHALAESSQ